MKLLFFLTGEEIEEVEARDSRQGAGRRDRCIEGGEDCGQSGEQEASCQPSHRCPPVQAAQCNGVILQLHQLLNCNMHRCALSINRSTVNRLSDIFFMKTWV